MLHKILSTALNLNFATKQKLDIRNTSVIARIIYYWLRIMIGCGPGARLKLIQGQLSLYMNHVAARDFI